MSRLGLKASCFIDLLLMAWNNSGYYFSQSGGLTGLFVLALVSAELTELEDRASMGHLALPSHVAFHPQGGCTWLHFLPRRWLHSRRTHTDIALLTSHRPSDITKPCGSVGLYTMWLSEDTVHWGS